MPRGSRSPTTRTPLTLGGKRWCGKPDLDWRRTDLLDLQQELELVQGQLKDTQRRLDETLAQLHRKRADEVRVRRLLRKEEAEVKALATKVESLEQLHLQLPATIGHEFRTPISIIQGWSEYLLDIPGRDPRDAEHLDEILRSSQDLSRKVDRSIMLSQALAGQLSFDPQPMELPEAIDRALGAYSEKIVALGLEVELRLPASLPPVWFDGICLDAVLSGVVENAVKFNRPHGSISVRSHRQKGGVLLSIRNTGAGIPVDRLDRVFRPFDQVDHGSTRKYSGLGLGLALVKQLVDLAGATISAASAGRDKGAIFRIWLPCMES